MALVAYSDSEISDIEDAPTPKASVTNTTAKLGVSHNNPSTKASTAGFRTTEARKIKVDLPAPKPDVTDGEAERPAKRARVGGGGFNSFLPAPKRSAEQSRGGLGRGVSLKTSSEAAFSRERPGFAGGQDEGGSNEGDGNASLPAEPTKTADVEVKEVGKATKFKPLSVQAGTKRKKPVKKPDSALPRDGNVGDAVQGAIPTQSQPAIVSTPVQGGGDSANPPPKPKRSLFSVPQAEDQTGPSDISTPSTYESLTTQAREEAVPTTSSTSLEPPPSTAQDITAGLDLTPAQRRQIFGRNGKTHDINVAHFNMDAEYASNEVLRQSGETVEHKAVKSIAPGKHSLQQLVNNAKSQQDNLEDKWAEGRRERGEGSSRYGWGR